MPLWLTSIAIWVNLNGFVRRDNFSLSVATRQPTARRALGWRKASAGPPPVGPTATGGAAGTGPLSSPAVGAHVNLPHFPSLSDHFLHFLHLFFTCELFVLVCIDPKGEGSEGFFRKMHECARTRKPFLFHLSALDAHTPPILFFLFPFRAFRVFRCCSSASKAPRHLYSLLSTLYSLLAPMRPIYNMFAREAVPCEKYFATFLRKDLHGSQNRRTFAPAKRERPLRGKA